MLERPGAGRERLFTATNEKGHLCSKPGQFLYFHLQNMLHVRMLCVKASGVGLYVGGINLGRGGGEGRQGGVTWGKRGGGRCKRRGKRNCGK